MIDSFFSTKYVMPIIELSEVFKLAVKWRRPAY